MIFYLFYILFFIQFVFSESTFNSLEFSSNATSHALHNGSIASSSKYISINPASISIKKNQFEISQFILPADIKNSTISYSLIKNTKIFFFKLNSMSYGTLKDDYANIEFKANDLYFELGQKSKFKNLFSIGFSIGYIKSSIYKYSSNGIFSNLGLRMNILNERLSFGASLNHFGIQLKKFINTQEYLPTTLRYGMGFRPLYLPVNIYLDFINYLNYKNKKIQIGFDFQFKNNINFRISTINTKNELETNNYYQDILNNFSFGLGLVINNKKINISIQNIGPAGMIYGVSILI